MNHIEVNQVMNCYNYPEPYWIIDGKPITVYLDEFVQTGQIGGLEQKEL